jgi:two-component system, OmpR family, sensor histidine kinase KdpD
MGVSASRGRLHVFLAAAPGAGKTYALLAEGRRQANSGADVVIGLAETHGRADTEAMAAELAQVPLRQVSYRGTTFSELDVDAVLARHPAVVLVDELAHACIPGSRHEKRWEDVEELLDAGIDVITSLNAQHLESLNDAAAAVTSVPEHETVPDAVVAAADQVDFLDITPERLRSRIANGVFGQDQSQAALSGFYSPEHLTGLRDLALGWLEQRDLSDRAARAAAGPATTPIGPAERMIVALTGAPEGEHVLRRAAHIAASVRAELIGVHVREPSGLIQAEPAWLAGQRRLLVELGGRYEELAGIDVATTVVDYARSEGARQLVLGATRWPRRRELLHGSVINKAIRAAGPIEVHVIPPLSPARHIESAAIGAPPPRGVALPGPRRAIAWTLAIIAPVLIAVALVPLRSSLGLAGALLVALVAVVGVALLGGWRPALLATATGILAADFAYTRPYYSFRVASAVDVVGLVTFGIVAIVVGGLVDRLTRQGVLTAKAKAEAEDLARLAADTVVSRAEPSEIVGSIRAAFDLDTVALLRREDKDWHVEACSGRSGIQSPDEADDSVEVASGSVLALAGHRLDAQEATLLRVFISELRVRRERAILDSRVP